MDKRMMHGGGAGAGVIWFIGWLFTIGFAQLVWWKMILGIGSLALILRTILEIAAV